MQPNSSLRRVGTAILVGASGIAGSLLTLAIAGSVFGTNFVCNTAKNPNCSWILGTRSFLTPAIAQSTETGGQLTYDVISMPSPFNSTASTRGLRTGTGTVTYLELDIISNHSEAPIDCTVVDAARTATGGTVLISNATATGSITRYTTPFTLGPTQRIKCGTMKTQTGATVFSASLRATLMDSDVTN